MGRPRRYVQVNGNEVVGISKMPDGRFYVLIGGKRKYFRSLDNARAAYRLSTHGPLTRSDRLLLNAEADLLCWRLRDFLSTTFPDACSKQLPEGVLEAGRKAAEDARKLTQDESLMGSVEDLRRLNDAFGIPRVALRAVPASRSEPPNEGGPTTSDVLSEYRKLKSLHTKGRETEHVRSVVRLFEAFTKVAGSTPLSRLSAEHFRVWREWVTREGVKRKTGKWSNDRHAAVKHVFVTVRRHCSDWPWPTGLSDWLDAYDRRAYLPESANKQPLPPREFQLLLQAADRWAHEAPEAVEASTQRGRGQRRQAIVRRELGVQLQAILRLGANCALDPVDFSRLERVHLRLDGRPPFLDLPRAKATHRVGAAIARKTPLLPSTVEALERVLKTAPPNGAVFRSCQGGAYSSLSATFRRLATAAGVDETWSFKHLRNIGPTLAKRAKLTRDERDAFLGHAVNGTSKFYEGDVDETYLLPLVNLIGKQYFGGESVCEPRGDSANHAGASAVLVDQ